jgi:membrane protein
MVEQKKIKSAHFKIKLENLWMKAAGIRDIFVDAISNYRANGDANQAAAIALYAILSAIPLFILTIIAAGYVFSSHPHIQEEITETIRSFNPYFSGQILSQLGQIEKKRQLLGWVGVLSLVWLSAMIFNSMATALNIIFRSQKKRNYFLAKLLAISMIPLAWIVGIVSVAISYVAALLVKQPALIAENLGFSLSAASAAMLRYIVPYLITALFFIVVYRLIPTTKIRLSVAIVGSAIFALLTEIAKQFFTWYIANYTRYNVIFGSLEAVVILVVGVFYIALIFLFCAEIMSSYQRSDMLLLERAMLKPHKTHLKIDERLFKKFGRAYPDGSVIFNEGDTGQEMYYILSGRVCLEKDACQVKKLLAEMGPGQYFGEMAVLINAPRTASARTLEDSHLAVIDGGTFGNLVRESQGVAILMLREFSRRLKNSNTALEELTNLWIRLIIIIHFLDNPSVNIEEHLPRLGQLTKKDPAEIREVLNDPILRDMFIIRDGWLVEVVRDKIWTLLDSGALTKCVIEEKDKI